MSSAPRPSLLLLFLLLAVPVSAAPASIESYAIVRDDASLIMRGREIRLFGVFFPQDGRVCEGRIRPVQCGTRAAQALRLKIQGFIECRPQARLSDGSLAAICYADGNSMLDPKIDLGAWLIQEGLAVAGPNAPFAYHTYERIARANERGLWGFQVDRIR